MLRGGMLWRTFTLRPSACFDDNDAEDNLAQRREIVRASGSRRASILEWK